MRTVLSLRTARRRAAAVILVALGATAFVWAEGRTGRRLAAREDSPTVAPTPRPATTNAAAGAAAMFLLDPTGPPQLPRLAKATARAKAQAPLSHTGFKWRLALTKGDWAYRESGVVLPGAPPFLPEGPFATVGWFTADGKGNLRGFETICVGGQVLPNQRFTGVATINERNGFGTSVITFEDGGTQVNVDWVLFDQGRQMHYVWKLNGTAITGSAWKQFR